MYIMTVYTNGCATAMHCLPRMQLNLHNTHLHVALITIFACVTLPEHYLDVCMGVQYSCLHPSLPRGKVIICRCCHKNARSRVLGIDGS